MSPFVWLGIAVVAGAAAYYFGATALGRYRIRQAQDENEDRYNAWRGRASRPGNAPIRGMTPDERRQIGIGLVLLVVAFAALVIFIATSA